MKLMNRFVFLTISFILSISSSCLIVASIHQMLMDPEYVKSLNAPPKHNIALQTMVGAIILFTLFIFFHLGTHIIFLILCCTKLKEKKIDLSDVIVKRNELYFNILRIAGYIVIILLIYSYIGNYIKFYIYNFMFRTTSILVVIIYITWIITIFKKQGHHRS